MTTYGPTLIRQCPSCKALVLQDRCTSGNTFEAVVWTDGKMEAPMLPDELLVGACPGCSAVLWANELPVAGEWDWYGKREEPPPGLAGNLRELTFEEYLAVAESGPLPDKKAEYLRIRAWWAGNDRRMLRAPTPPSQPGGWVSVGWGTRQRAKVARVPPTDAERRNMVELEKLLRRKTNEESRLMRAELLRQLGRFDEAVAPLEEGEFALEGRVAAERLRSLCARRDPFLAVLFRS